MIPILTRSWGIVRTRFELLAAILTIWLSAAGAEAAPPPQRIVPLAPSLAELCADLLGSQGQRIVGVTENADTPSSLSKKPSIGPYHRVHLEKLISLKPDLVLATRDGNSRDQIDRLKELGIPVVLVATGSLAQVVESIGVIAEAIGEKEKGRELSSKLRAGIEAIRKRHPGAEGPRVLMQVGSDPLVVVGAGTFLQDAIQAVGGRNLYSDSRTGYPRPSLEDILNRNPDRIIVVSMSAEEQEARRWAQEWARLPRLRAVQERAVRIVRGDRLARPTLRLLEGLEELERAIHGRS